MESKFVTACNTRIAYLESNPAGNKTIFFIHANSSSALTWKEQLEDLLLAQYRLIAVDLPAHGHSGALENLGAGYSLIELGRIVAGVVQQLCNDAPFILTGVSLGGNIIAEMLAHQVRPAGIILTGPCLLGPETPMDRVFQPGIDLHAAFSDHVPEAELKQYARLAFYSEDEIQWKAFVRDYYQVKDQFRSKLFATVTAGDHNDEISLLRQSDIPLLIIFGAMEKACDPNYLDHVPLGLWKGTVCKVPAAGHFVHIDQPRALNRLIHEYAENRWSDAFI